MMLATITNDASSSTMPTDQRQVAALDRGVDGQLADAVVVEHPLGDDRAAQQPGEVEAPDALNACVDPQRQVQQDARAACEREQGEHEADERRVDAQPRRDAGADAGDHAVVPAALEERCGRGGHAPSRTTSIRPAPTFASITSAAPEPVLTLALWPSSRWSKT